jgi:hypothetical protein
MQRACLQGPTFYALLAVWGAAAVAACSSNGGMDLGGTHYSHGSSGAGPDGSTSSTTSGSGGGTTGGSSGGSGGGDLDAADEGDDGGDGGPDLDTIVDPLFNLPTGAQQLAILCARNNGDAVSKAFCSGAAPTITSLADVEQLLGLDFKAGNDANGRNGNPAFVLTGHSTSLVTHFTSAINPRAIIFTPPKATGRVANNPQPLASFTALGFVRGEEFVEFVSNDPTANGGKGDLNFFLFRFQHDCDSSPSGCTYGDLLTPAVESNFTGVYSLYQEQDVKDTIFDCQQCHQPSGPTTSKLLRQQELQNPWGHFFRNNRVNGEVLISDFQAAHGTAEEYGGIPAAAITNSDPAQLEGLVEGQGFADQPNEYDTSEILTQVQQVNPNEPASNVPPGTSAAWSVLYANAQAGNVIPPPYHDIKVTDPTLLATATSAYQSFLGGTLPASQLPDIRDIFLASALSDLTFQPAAGLDGNAILVQMCQQCHNSKLDQTETRERFRVDQLDQMSATEKALAVHRLNLPDNVFRKMPPPRFRSLSASDIAAVTAVLQQ